jgi:hypothetical protein
VPKTLFSPTFAKGDAALAELRAYLNAAAKRRVRDRHTTRLTLAALVVAALGVGAAVAATRLSSQNFPPADLERQYTVVTNDRWAECGQGGCVTKTGTHKQLQILPSMGVSFVLPSGQRVQIVPAAGAGLGPLPTFRDDEAARFGLPGIDTRSGKFIHGSIRLRPGSGSWTVELPDGAERTISWQRATGSVTMTDRAEDGSRQTAELHAGDVVTLVPDSIDPEAQTLEKAVTFDLPEGGRVHILPSFNTAYVGSLPHQMQLRSQPGTAFAPLPLPPRQLLPRAEAERYGLTPTGPYDAKLPTTKDGGEWRVVLPDGTQRTISWEAGDDYVTIRDLRDGRTDEQRITIGHQIPLVPFR